MIKYELRSPLGHPVIVSLDTDSVDERVPIEYEGRPKQVAAVRRLVEGASGPRGAPIQAVTTARALRYAMQSDLLLIRRSPRLLEGHGLFG